MENPAYYDTRPVMSTTNGAQIALGLLFVFITCFVKFGPPDPP